MIDSLTIKNEKLRIRHKDNSRANTFTFPEGSQIPGKGYLVICRDTLKFNKLHLNIKNFYGNFDFGLSSDGDMVLLFDSGNNLIDSIYFYRLQAGDPSAGSPKGQAGQEFVEAKKLILLK